MTYRYQPGRHSVSVSGRFKSRLAAEAARTGLTMAAIVRLALAGIPQPAKRPRVVVRTPMVAHQARTHRARLLIEARAKLAAAVAALGMPDDVPWCERTDP